MTAKELKYPIDFKEEVCLYAKKENIKSAAAVYGVHRNTVSRWLKKYRSRGMKGLIVKRNDTQETKIDSKTLEKIVRYKKKNPKATLKEIKEKYSLDCHISLIARKLSKVVKAERRPENESVLLRLRVVKRTLLKGDEITVYRFSIHSCSGKLLSIGFADSYYSENICFFVRYSFERLKALKKFKAVKTVYTPIICIKKGDFDNIVRSRFKTELKFISKKDNIFCAKNDINHTGRDIEPSIEESFEKILDSYSGSKFQNILLTSIVDVRKLSTNGSDNIRWNELPMPSETKKSLYSVLRKIKSKGDRAVMEFDFETAKKEYDKAYSVISSLDIDDKMLLNSILLDKAKLYYNVENYHSALMLFRDCMKVSKKNGAVKELADSYYYIGLIQKHFQNTRGAVKYFTLSAAELKDKKDSVSVCMHYRAKYRRYLTEEKFKKAEEFSHLYHEAALETEDKKLIGNCLSTRGAYLYKTTKYEEYETTLLEAKEYNITYNNLHDACDNITNLLSLYCYSIEKDIEIINSIVSELEMISRKVKREFLVYNSRLKLGILFFNKSNYLEAEKWLNDSLHGTKKYLSKESYLSNLYYLGRSKMEIGQIKEAVRFLNRLQKVASKCGNKLYQLSALRILLKIYLQKSDKKKVICILNKSIIFATQLQNSYICGELHNYFAEFFENKKRRKETIYHYLQAKRCYLNCSKEKNLDLSSEIAEIDSKLEYFK